MRDIGAAIADIAHSMPGLDMRYGEPMSERTSFRIGGPAAAMAFPASAQEAAELASSAREHGVEPFIMGNGTNLLCGDGPLSLLVIKLDERMSAIERVGENRLRCLAGAPLARIAQRAQSLGLAGFEFAAGIPGTIGGAVSMNAGAYGGEMKDVTRRVSYIGQDGRIREKNAAELELSYRHSVFSGTGGAIVSAELELYPDDPALIRDRMRELGEKRRASQPLELPSAGSTFKRPKGGYAAALIDEAGLKGFAIGGAQVSEKHAGFIVNRGGATFDDVLRLMEHIIKTVLDRSGVELEPEIKIIRG